MRSMRCAMAVLWTCFFSAFIYPLFGQTEQVRINEFMALNGSTLTDGDGDYSDWIELYNAGDQPVSLLGWSLTDDPEYPQEWIFPEVTLNAGEYLVVFASGKDRKIPGYELHTSFKLSGDGEYLSLMDAEEEVVTEFSPLYPPQETDVSYGYFEGTYIPFNQPSPGSANQQGGVVISPPVFSVGHGIYESPFDLQITCDVPGASIYYTTDGSAPTPGSGKLYSSVIHIDHTSVIRAVAALDNQNVGVSVTCTYLFLEDVIHQPNDPEGYPSEWGPYTAIPGTSVADYEMDPELMQDPAFAASVKEGLLSLPTMSLVTDIGYLFSHSTDPDTGGIYIYTGPPLDRVEDGLGKGWERPASMEYFDADGSESFQVNCGVRIQGGHSRRPEKSPKHSFRLVFRSEFGPGRLNYPLFGDENAVTSFNTLILRAGFGLSWIHHSHYERQQAQYQRDVWAKDTQRAMGYPSSHSEYVHLYINGIYWGVYAPSERLDGDFGASYMDGEASDYDVIKDYQDVIDGNITAWNEMLAMANAGLETNEAYQQIQGNRPDGTPDPGNEAMVDAVNLADYMLINFYGSNTDWDHHNWAAIRNRNNPGKGFKFLCWDSEHLLKSEYGNVLGIYNSMCPSNIFQQLMENEEYKRVFADRVQRYCFDGGLLTPEGAGGRWIYRMNQVEPAINDESARWGDYRRDVHQFQPGGPFDLYGYENYWVPQRDFMVNTYFPNRTGIFLDQLRSAGLFPLIDAPLLRVNGLPINGQEPSTGDTLSMISDEGVIYYTLNGTDPVDWGVEDGSGETVLVTQDAEVYTQPIQLEQSVHVRARTYLEGSWSAMTDRFITFTEDLGDLRFTEVHYHPLPDGTVSDREFEFLELKNTGSSTLDLGGVRFLDGIEYEFPPETELGPGEFVVLASNARQFASRYGLVPTGEYSGNLNNGGEWIVLGTSSGDTIAALLYGDTDPWPLLADGTGNSMVPVEFNPGKDQSRPADWRDSYYSGGSPGRDDTESTSVEERLPDTPAYSLAQNYPNPFSDLTYIAYTLPREGTVELSVYNLMGQKVALLEASHRNAGSHLISWNGDDSGGSRVEAGIYFYRMVIRDRNGEHILSRKMIRY